MVDLNTRLALSCITPHPWKNTRTDLKVEDILAVVVDGKLVRNALQRLGRLHDCSQVLESLQILLKALQRVLVQEGLDSIALPDAVDGKPPRLNPPAPFPLSPPPPTS